MFSAMKSFAEWARLFGSKDLDRKLEELQCLLDEWDECPEHLKRDYVKENDLNYNHLYELERKRHLMARQLDVDKAFNQIKWIYSLRSYMLHVCVSNPTLQPHEAISLHHAQIKSRIFDSGEVALETHRKLMCGGCVPLCSTYENEKLILMTPRLHVPEDYHRDIMLRTAALVIFRTLCVPPKISSHTHTHTHTDTHTEKHTHTEVSESVGISGALSVCVDLTGAGPSNIERGVGATLSIMIVALTPPGVPSISRIFACNLTLLFRALWSLLSPVLLKRWVKRIFFMSNDTLRKTIAPPSYLPHQLGGTLPLFPPHSILPTHTHTHTHTQSPTDTPSILPTHTHTHTHTVTLKL
eukprot:GHVR01176403.1.p1 GENE.GHVR01176403.1~~GHVR01176403.1.p1  ORF type:complete len:354 (+),score=146.19 GHVR01176403.1:84-1145(+)